MKYTMYTEEQVIAISLAAFEYYKVRKDLGRAISFKEALHQVIKVLKN